MVDANFEPLHRISREILAAGLGCALADGSLNALEVTKVKMQVQSASKPYYRGGMVGCMRTCIAEDGLWHGLCRPGLGATLVRAMTYVGFRVGLYPSVRDRVHHSIDSSAGVYKAGASGSLCAKIMSGMITGGVGSCLFCPIDVVRVRMQAEAGTLGPAEPNGNPRLLATGLRRGEPVQYRSTWQAFRKIYSSQGWTGLYVGALPTVARATLLSGSQLGSYDALKQFAKARIGLEEAAPLHVSCSLVSGLIAQTVIQPVDTLRSHVMAGEGRARHHLSVQGIRWLFRGYTAACCRQGPIMLLQLPLTEQIRIFLGVGAM